MLRAYAYSFAGVAQYLKALENIKPNEPKTLAEMFEPEKLDETTRLILPAFRALSEWLPIPSVVAQLDRIRDVLNRAHTHSEILALIVALRDRLQDDLESQMFFHVRPEDVALYEGPMLFGDAVNSVFKEAADDIEAAGKCLAFRQGTATVFHLMRVLEVGLKRLANLLKVPYAPSWESYLKQINDRVAAKHRTKGVSWKRDEPFFRDLAGDLQIIKIAWRNPTMHIVRKYTSDEADEIFRASKTFMVRLATHVLPKA